MPSSGSTLEVIAPAARFITFPVTDGDSARWPENTRTPPSSAREVNWNRKMTLDERFSCRWRNLIGQGIAKLLDKPDKEKYCLQAFPAEYWMFDHHKGPVSNIRHDLYLYGSKTAQRFRSPAEFIPHGYWLLTDPTLNTKNCGCKYCGGGGKKSQTEISEALGLPTNRGPTAVTGQIGAGIRSGPRPSGRGVRTSGGPWIPREMRERRQIESAWTRESLGLDLVANSTMISDLRSRRRFRMGELVWCVWDAGVPNTSPGKNTDPGATPLLWPSIIVDCSLRAHVEHLPVGLNNAVQVVHRRLHTVRRLGSLPSEEDEFTLDEDEILPWHAHSASLHARPLPVKAASNSLRLALHTAENLVKSWAVCDRIPLRIPASSAHLNPIYAQTWDGDGDSISVTSRVLPSSHHYSASSRSTPFSTAYSVDSTPPQRSPVRLAPANANRAAKTTIPLTLASIPQNRRPSRATVVETRYQGIWYGAERIWTGDLVRLNPEREAFDASLRLSAKMLGGTSWQRRPKSALVPGTGVLMRVDKIFTRIGEAGAKECAVAGPIYEVSPVEFEDGVGQATAAMRPSPATPPASEVSGYPWDMNRIPSPSGKPDRKPLVDQSLLPLPPAPEGYTLRALLPHGSELPLPLSFVAGRYYADILQWPLLAFVAPKISKVLSGGPPSANILSELVSKRASYELQLQSLCALVPGRFNHAVCVDIRLANRVEMIEKAERAVKTGDGERTNTMEVD